MKNKKLLLLILGLIMITQMIYSQVPSYVPTNGLVGYWPFNGNANDQSGNGLNGTVTGATLTNDRNGNADGAYLFNSSVASNISIQTQSVTGTALQNQFSIVMWVKANRVANYIGESTLCPGSVSVPMANSNQNWAFVPGNSGSNLGVGFSIGTNGVMVTEHANNILVSRLSNSSTYSSFVQVAIVYDSNNSYLYVNGALVRTSPMYCTSNIKMIPSLLTLGASLYSPNFSGVIDDLGLWNRALTAYEVQFLFYEAQLTLTPGCSTSAPTGIASQTLCSGSTVANLSATGTSIQWYSTSTGGTALASSTALVTGTTYYASQTVSGCESTSRLAVVVSLNNPTVSASSTTVCSGQPTTLTASSGASTTSNFSVGSIGPSGGFVFYDKGSVTNGWRYLEVASVDYGTPLEWGCDGTNIAGTSTALGTGQTNTNLIIQNCSSINIAARACDNAVINGYSDWYLPSRDDFNLIYQNLNPLGIGNFINSNGNQWNRYWTSSQIGAYAYAQDFTPYYQQITQKVNQNKVRPIRQFATGTPFSSYLWSTGATTSSISVNPTSTTQYWVDVTTNGVTCRKEITITVNPNITPTFTQVAPICSGATLSALPTTSNNSITGTWSPALNNTATTTYTFTPNDGQCASTTTMTITVNPNVTPTFTQLAPICSGAPLSALPMTSNNYISGTWSPALNNTATTTYTFTPSDGQCATSKTMTITVNPLTTYYVDSDGDGFGAGPPVLLCSPTPPTGYATNNSDCNDALSTLTTSCIVIIPIKVMIQGYYKGSGQMTPVRKNAGLSSSNDEVDEVTVALYSPFNVNQVVATTTVILANNGNITAQFDTTLLAESQYYIAIQHKNTIKTWSATPVAIINGTTYDFTTAASQAYGNNQIEVAPRIYAIYSGDMNQDGTINDDDLPIFTTANITAAHGYIVSDLNGDGSVDLLDYPIYKNNAAASVNEVRPLSQSSQLPVVTTNNVVYQDGLVALGSGSVTISGGVVIARGLCWSVDITPTINSDHTTNGQGQGTFSESLDNLLPNTTYRVRAYATSDAGVAYGEEKLFRTNNYPSLYKIIPKFVYTTSVSLELAVLFDGNSSITQRGVCWSTQENPTISNSNSIIGSGEGYYYKIITGLTPNTTYYIRPFATNGIGTSYGETIIVNTTDSYTNLDDLYAMIYEPGGITGNKHNDFGQKGVDIWLDMLSGDMALSNNTYGWYKNTANLVSTVDNTRDENRIIRDYYFNIIHACNAIITPLTPFGGLPSDNERRWALGQALALRAHSYFYLIQCFQQEYNTNEIIFPLYNGAQSNNSPVQMNLIYNLVRNDLQTAITLLSNYVRPSKTNIDKNVAKGILAYAYAFMNNYSQAKTLADEIINSNEYPLTPTGQLAFPGAGSGFNDVSTPSWMWGVDLTTEMGHQLVNWWGQMDYFTYSYQWAGDRKTIDTGLLALIPAGDVRGTQYGTSGITNRMPINKFYHPGRTAGGQRLVTTDYIFMRVDEFYLLSAEAAAKMGSDAIAKARLKELVTSRFTGGAADADAYVDPLSGDALKQAIYNQTKMEMWGEGKSYLAMKRNQATITRGSNHVFRAGESFLHNSDELTFNYSSNYVEYVPPALESLNCDSVVFNSANSALVLNQNVTNFSFEIPYTTSNGGNLNFDATQFQSTGVTGLVASIEAGIFEPFQGNLMINITGTPSSYGTANFNINIGGKNCILSLEVLPLENCNSNTTILAIDFDAFQEETYWKIFSVNDPNTPIFEGGFNGEYAGMENILLPFCLEDGDYVLSFFDTNNNGLTNGGYYRLYDLNGNTYACGSTFSNQDITMFSTGVDNNTTTIELSIRFDNYPEETAWKLYDSSLNLIDSGGFDAAGSAITGYAALGFAARSTFSMVKCLTPGTYTFVIFDAYGDGMDTSATVQGTYSIKNLTNGATLFSGQGNFGAFSEHQFVIE